MLETASIQSDGCFLCSDYLPDSLVPLIEKAASALERYMPQPYAGEMKGEL